MAKLESGHKKEEGSDVQALKNQLSVLEGADLRALQQLESISTAFSTLQTQFKAQTDAMVEKEKHITKLLADKTRVEQRIALATNEKNAISNKMLGVNKEMTRLTTHCTELEQLKEKQSTQLVLFFFFFFGRGRAIMLTVQTATDGGRIECAEDGVGGARKASAIADAIGHGFAGQIGSTRWQTH